MERGKSRRRVTCITQNGANPPLRSETNFFVMEAQSHRYLANVSFFIFQHFSWRRSTFARLYFFNFHTQFYFLFILRSTVLSGYNYRFNVKSAFFNFIESGTANSKVMEKLLLIPRYLSAERKIINIQPAPRCIGYKVGYEYISRDTNVKCGRAWNLAERVAILLKINGCKWSNRTVTHRARNIFHCHARQNKHITGAGRAFKLDIIPQSMLRSFSGKCGGELRMEERVARISHRET